MPRKRGGRVLGKTYGCFDGEAQRRPARNVERQVGAHVDPGQAHDRDGGHGESAAGRPEAGKGSSAQGDGNAGVPGEVPQPGGVAATAARACH